MKQGGAREVLEDGAHHPATASAARRAAGPAAAGCGQVEELGKDRRAPRGFGDEIDYGHRLAAVGVRVLRERGEGEGEARARDSAGGPLRAPPFPPALPPCRPTSDRMRLGAVNVRVPAMPWAC